MAILRLENSKTYTQFSDIIREIAPLNIHLERYCVRKTLDLQELLNRQILNNIEKAQILQAARPHFESVKRSTGYLWRDLMGLHPGSANLYTSIAHSDRSHTHTDSEALYMLAGECLFGFVRPDGSQVELIVQEDEYINIPGGTEHWFCPTAKLHIKAVRYFTTPEGWVPHYTNTKICFR